MNPVIQQALQKLFGISQPSQQTQQVTPGLVSPVPQSQIVPHQKDFSDIQSAIGNAIMGLTGQNQATQQSTQHPQAVELPQATATPQPTATMQQAIQQIRQYQPNNPISDTQIQNLYGKYGSQILQNVQPSPTPTAMQTATEQMSPTQVPTPIDANQSLFPHFTTAPVPGNLAPLIHDSAVKAGIDPNVFASLLFSEHGFQTTPGINMNTNGSYDRGIAQINNQAHPEITDQQAIDPNFAVPYAANLLSKYIQDMGGDYNKGIASYNVGEGGANNPQIYNGAGKRYLNKIAQGLSPDLLKQLGIQTGN